jgi:hypothetical protein
MLLVQVFRVATSLHLLIWAFPALTELRLSHVDLGDGALSSMLAVQPTCPISSLTLTCCNIKDTAVDAAATALARLPSLKACCVTGGGTVPLRIASQLTGLTQLQGEQEAGVPPPDTQLVKAVSRNKGLQSLRVSFTRSVSLSAKMLQCLLTSCINLTQLDLTFQRVNDEGLDILLQHGTNITDVRFEHLDLTRSRADSICKWESLWLDLTDPLLAGLAYLPLRSVQKLETGYTAGTLHLSFLPSSKLVLLLQQAVSNLKACPAWQKQPAARILLYAHPWHSTAIPDSQAAQLLHALSPLAGPHLQHLGVSIDVEFGQEEVQVLASSSLRSLSLRRGVIKPSFWPALSQHLPHLKELGLAYKVDVNLIGMVAYLRTLTQPFTLYIGLGVVPGHILAKLTNIIGEWQLQRVSVKDESPDDEQDFQCVDELEDYHLGQQEADSEGDTDPEGSEEDEDEEVDDE